MLDLDFRIEGVSVERYAIAPLLSFDLRIACADAGVAVQNVSLQAQVRIDAARRRYAEADTERLTELFGAPAQWSRSLHSMLWVHTTANVPAFEGKCSVKLPVPCTFDFNVAATKYFHALEGGEVPLNFLFSGAVFYRDADGALQIDHVSWNKEAAFRLPVSVWQEMMALHYPDGAWLRVPIAVFDRLHAFKRARGLTGWEQALTLLLDEQRTEAAP